MHTFELKTSNGVLCIQISIHQRNSIYQLQFSGYNSYKIGDYISGIKYQLISGEFNIKDGEFQNLKNGKIIK